MVIDAMSEDLDLVAPKVLGIVLSAAEWSDVYLGMETRADLAHVGTRVVVHDVVYMEIAACCSMHPGMLRRRCSPPGVRGAPPGLQASLE